MRKLLAAVTSPGVPTLHQLSKWILGAMIPWLLCALPAFAGDAGAATRGEVNVEALIQGGHWKRARTILEPLVKDHPQDPQSCYELAEVKAAFKDLNGALTLAQHAVDLEGNNSNFHLKLGQVYGELAARASMFSVGPLVLKFRKEVETAIQLMPTNLEALDSMMLFKFQAPTVLGGSKEEARVLAEKITALSASEGYLAQAELAELEKDTARREANLVKAAQADPKNYSAVTTLAEYYSRSPHANYNEAATGAQAAVKLDGTQIGGYWILARVYALEQSTADLEVTLSAAEKAVPDDLRPFYEAAQALMESGKDLRRAEDLARHYLAQEPEGGEPEKADVHRLLGLLFEKEGRKAEALAEIQTALQLRPNFRAAKDDLKRMSN